MLVAGSCVDGQKNCLKSDGFDSSGGVEGYYPQCLTTHHNLYLFTLALTFVELSSK